MGKQKIGICHYRVGQTDGVSLEIKKRKRVLEDMGYTVKLISGERQVGADYIIPELEFDREEIVKIKLNAFSKRKDYTSEKDLIKDIYKVAKVIEKKFLEINKKENFDLLYLHNIFTHGRHIAAAKAFCDIQQRTDIKFISVNHDFYEFYGDMYIPKLKAIKVYLKKFVPPSTSKIKHIVINSITKKHLFDKIGQKAMIFPDTFNFDQKSWVKDDYNSTLLSDLGIKDCDLVILQATRIVERKAIELTIDFTTKLQKKRKDLVGKTLYNMKKITKDSKIILLLAGYTEPASKEYGRKLNRLCNKNKIKAIFAEDFIQDQRSKRKDGKKIYSLWDSYVYADLVSYPSTWEGWGNQFIEAVFAKKPIIIFEYPVFKADIKKEGYSVISLGDKIDNKCKDGLVKIHEDHLEKVVDEIIKVLTDSKTKEGLNKNFRIGDKYHGEKALKKLLQKSLNLFK